LSQQKLLGPIGVCPAGHDEFEHVALGANVDGGQHWFPIWTFGCGQLGWQVAPPSRTRRISFGLHPPGGVGGGGVGPPVGGARGG